MPPARFYPAPKVPSSVIRMPLRGQPPAEVGDPDLFFQVVRAAFGQRRKTLLNALHAMLGKGTDKEMVRQAIVSCNLPDTVRGERLSFAEFAQLSRKIGEIQRS